MLGHTGEIVWRPGEEKEKERRQEERWAGGSLGRVIGERSWAARAAGPRAGKRSWAKGEREGEKILNCEYFLENVIWT
jgi:hypothetical protein